MSETNSNPSEKPMEDLNEKENEALPENEEITAKKHDCAAIERELADWKEKASQAQDQTLRARAEMENVRKVAEKDVANAHQFALKNFVSDLIGVVDSLEHALIAHDTNDPIQQKLCEGIELTLTQFLKVLNKYGVEQINPVDEIFQPEWHQAISTEEAKDKTANTVIKVLQKGYSLKGRLLRPALVLVAK